MLAAYVGVVALHVLPGLLRYISLEFCICGLLFTDVRGVEDVSYMNFRDDYPGKEDFHGNE